VQHDRRGPECVRYRAKRPVDAALRARLRELADQRRRFGYRRLHVLLRGEGWTMNRKKTQRLYGEEGLAVRRRRSRRRIAVARTPIPKPEGPNSRWSTDPRHGPRTSGGTMARSTTSSPTAAGSGC
jgi:transposase InsO family protein